MSRTLKIGIVAALIASTWIMYHMTAIKIAFVPLEGKEVSIHSARKTAAVELIQKEMLQQTPPYDLVLSTLARDIAFQHPHRVGLVTFHLLALASMVKQTKTRVRIIVYTADEMIQEYVNKEDLPLQVVMIPKAGETDFNFFLENMYTLYGDAKAYGFFNGDIHPTVMFIDQVNGFFQAHCPSNKRNDSNWRFASTLRYDVVVPLDKLLKAHDQESDDPLRVLSTAPGELYWKNGVDYFSWNRAMFVEHILPTIPKFTMPLERADNKIWEDADCNALVFTANFKTDKLLYHVNHRHLPPANGEWVVSDWGWLATLLGRSCRERCCCCRVSKCMCMRMLCVLCHFANEPLFLLQGLLGPLPDTTGTISLTGARGRNQKAILSHRTLGRKEIDIYFLLRTIIAH
jgi:hypothetical protein